jgi:hypothetical protein
MTNRVAFWLALFIAFLVALDLWSGGERSLFLVRKLLELVNTLVFWR